MIKSMMELRKENPDFRVLYHNDYWDGPISGVCLWNGSKQYYDILHWEKYSDDDLGEWKVWEKYCKENGIEVCSFWDNETIYYTDRVYAVYDTPRQVISVIENRHHWFCKFVGNHCNYDKNGKRLIGFLKPNSEHEKFYNGDIEKPSIRKEEWKIIGEFVLPV
jgi:hypothetical protein